MKADFRLTIGDNIIVNEQYGSAEDAEKFLLFCHGFPGTNRLVKLAGSLKDEPVSIIEINYEGDKKSEGKFGFLRSMEDVKRTANYLNNEYGKPVCALGYSMGGLYASNVVRGHTSLFEKAILLNPVIDTPSLFSNDALMKELWMYADKILSLENPNYYEREIRFVNERCNPMDFAKELETPITIVQSAADEVISPETVKEFYSMLNCKKKYFELPNAKHDLMGDEEQLIQAIIE